MTMLTRAGLNTVPDKIDIKFNSVSVTLVKKRFKGTHVEIRLLQDGVAVLQYIAPMMLNSDVLHLDGFSGSVPMTIHKPQKASDE